MKSLIVACSQHKTLPQKPRKIHTQRLPGEERRHTMTLQSHEKSFYTWKKLTASWRRKKAKFGGILEADCNPSSRFSYLKKVSQWSLIINMNIPKAWGLVQISSSLLHDDIIEMQVVASNSRASLQIVFCKSHDISYLLHMIVVSCCWIDNWHLHDIFVWNLHGH